MGNGNAALQRFLENPLDEFSFSTCHLQQLLDFLTRNPATQGRETSGLKPDDSGYSPGLKTTSLHLQGHHCPHGAFDSTHIVSECVATHWFCWTDTVLSSARLCAALCTHTKQCAECVSVSQSENEQRGLWQACQEDNWANTGIPSLLNSRRLSWRIE